MKALSHSQAKQWIQLAADGLLPVERQQNLHAHLQGCAECGAYAAELSALEANLSEALKAHWPQSGLPTHRKGKLVKELQSQFGKSAGGAGSWTRLLWLAPLVVLAGLTTWFYGLGGQPRSQGTAPAQVSATATASQTATPSASPTPTAAVIIGDQILVAIPQQTVNCREGNSNQFDIADTLLGGEEYKPEARGNDQLWVRFRGPSFGELCWVFADNLDLLINDQAVAMLNIPEALLPYASYPPTPTPTIDVDEGKHCNACGNAVRHETREGG